MALRKSVNNQPKTTQLRISLDSDLLLKLEKISEQTGLSSINLLQKWILQEEAMIGVIQRSRKHIPKQAEARPRASKSVEPVVRDYGSPDYRKMIANKAKKLKKEGMTHKKIAETFNDEKISTVSGSGKWYSSSINLLLNPKK